MISQPPEMLVRVEGRLVRRSNGEWEISADSVTPEI
jgi:hypothetical protein